MAMFCADWPAMTMAFAACAVLMQLVALAEKGVMFEAEWVLREANEEADALANGDWQGFSPDRRLAVFHAWARGHAAESGLCKAQWGNIDLGSACR